MRRRLRPTRSEGKMVARAGGSVFLPALAFLALSLTPWGSAASSLPYPSLSFVEKALLTTATDDFGGHVPAFKAAAKWDEERLRSSSGKDVRAPHLACTEYGRGLEAFSRLRQFLSSEAVRPVAHSSEHGACFFATASQAQVAAISATHDRFGLTSLAPLPSTLKLAPGVLEHAEDNRSGHLGASHGAAMRIGNVDALTVELSPGTLAAHSVEAESFVENLLEDLMSESLDLHSTNFWSDPTLVEGEHLATAGGAVRKSDWSMAAALVHKLGKSGNTSPGDICSWDSVGVHHAADDLLVVRGLDHLLFLGRGVGGHEDEATDLHVACFMGLVSFLASRQEVLRIAPKYPVKMLDASVRAIIQSATSTDTPLTAAGLDGTGEIIQVVDSGLDETSCFFADGDGQQVRHGHYFEELSTLGIRYSTTEDGYYDVYSIKRFEGGDFYFDPSRRKIVQYIDLVNRESSASYFSYGGYTFPWLPADGFGDDERAGHGTHTAGTAAGSTLNSPAETTTCDSGEDLSCAGACIDATYFTDDLVSFYYQLFGFDIDRQCPMFGCDDDNGLCLGDEVGVTLAANGGMAQGAKLAIFDVAADEAVLSDPPGNGLWEPCMEAGCKIHSNSWGSNGTCIPEAFDILYDEFMYSNPEHLLIFAAGNDGENQFDTECTIGAPATAKNVIAVGATSSGETRLNSDGVYDIDHVATLSSWGPTKDGRIKPELVAPGDTVYSAAGDGTDLHTCRLWAYSGTSMSTPVVAGASAMVRQYFVDEQFYTADVTARGFCGDGFLCEGFSPSSATVKALLINSANLMGGDSKPNGRRGFGRVHLEMGLPLDGEDSLALYVADSSGTSIGDSSEREFLFEVDADAGLDFRATLCWIDPPATSFSGVQLVHDLDLSVLSPNGTTYTMWGSGEKDAVNVIERVVVDAGDVESGTWMVSVSSNSLTAADEQSYSLVVNGAISPAAGGVTDTENVVDSTIADEDSASHTGARTASGWSVAVGAAVSITVAFYMS